MNNRVVVVLFFLATGVALFSYYMLAGLIPKYDALNLFSPYFSLVADYARAGRLLLWNPYVNCGSPDMAYVEMGSFSPLTIALALSTGGGHTGFLVYWIVIWGIFGAGAGLLGLRLGAPLPAALAIAVSLMCSGFFLSDATHTSWLYGFVFLPLILWRLEAALDGGGRWPAVEAGVLFGLSALAGHPALVILNGINVGVWALGRAVFPATRDAVQSLPATRRTLTAAGSALLLLAAGTVVLSPAYFAFLYEAAGYSERVGYLARSIAVSNEALDPGALATLASPWFTAADFVDHLWPRTNSLLTCCYLGAMLPALGLAALFIRRDGFRLWIFAAGLLFLAAAVGDALPLRGWLYDYLPPTRFFRHSAVMRVYFMFSVGVAAMIGSRELLSARAWKVTGLVAAGLFPLALTIFFHTLAGTKYRDGLGLAEAQLIVWPLLIGVCLIGWRMAGRGRGSVGLWLLLGLVLIDATFSLAIAQDYMVIEREGFKWVSRIRKHSLDLRPRGLFRTAIQFELSDQYFSGKLPVLEGFNQLSNRFHSMRSLTPLPTSWCQEPPLSAAVIGTKSRIWFSPTAAVVHPSDATFMALVQRARELDAMPLALHRPADLLAVPPRGVPGPDDGADAQAILRLPACRRLDVELAEYTPTRLAFTVNCPADGWLLVTDRWSRSWRARRDGQAAEALGGNFLFRAMAVKSGPQRVEFEFRPFLHPLLFLLSWGTMTLTTIMTVVLWWNARRRHPP